MVVAGDVLSTQLDRQVPPLFRPAEGQQRAAPENRAGRVAGEALGVLLRQLLGAREIGDLELHFASEAQRVRRDLVRGQQAIGDRHGLLVLAVAQVSAALDDQVAGRDVGVGLAAHRGISARSVRYKDRRHHRAETGAQATSERISSCLRSSNRRSSRVCGKCATLS